MPLFLDGVEVLMCVCVCVCGQQFSASTVVATARSVFQ